jgi:anti-sigma B factor antagonist
MHPEPAASALRVYSHRDGSTYVLQLMGELGAAGVEAVEKELHRVEQTNVERILVDLSCLEFIDSSGIALLVRAHQRSVLDSDRLRMKRSDYPAVQRILGIAQLEGWLPFIERPAP